jgi:radical SAM superfamily enzyme YgiQ (UPF0313 family)
MRILLATPPLTQLNTPYPATAYLTGFLKHRGIAEVAQEDPAIDLVLRLFSRSGVQAIEAEILKGVKITSSASITHFVENAEHIAAVIDSVVRYLQGKDPSLAMRIATRGFLPEGPRFRKAFAEFGKVGDENLDWAFGSLGVQDRAKYFASLFIDDLADALQQGVDPRFQLSRYGEKLAASQPTFDPLLEALQSTPTLVDRTLDQITEEYLQKHKPQVLALTAPFPGNVYGAFRMARVAKQLAPEIRTVLGGGYPNTELRELKDPRVFDFFDAITLDDGEKPFLCLLEYWSGKRPREKLLRTFMRPGKQVEWCTSNEHDIPLKDCGTPTYAGLDLGKYLAILEMLNPMHRVWSDGRWNKLTLAHGCYWKKCNFCDVTLDYIGRYEPAQADVIVDRMIRLKEETGQSGFHFVDEAAPPALLKALAQRLIEREVVVTWWGNIRFEKAFTPELCQLLATSGCVAVSGGLEVASPRLLEKMNKGVTVEQVARVTQAFTQAGVLVHAYLMYGFPTQTEQETIDALERVRQLFEEGCLQSAYWHRFSTTAHSPIGKEPGKFGIRILPEPPVSFARNDLAFEDPTGVDHDRLGRGLKKALFNYMHGLGFDTPVQRWFEGKAPKTTLPPDFIRRTLR